MPASRIRDVEWRWRIAVGRDSAIAEIDRRGHPGECRHRPEGDSWVTGLGHPLDQPHEGHQMPGSVPVGTGSRRSCREGFDDLDPGAPRVLLDRGEIRI